MSADSEKRKSKIEVIAKKYDAKGKFVKLADKWAVEESPPTLVGAWMGVLFALTLAIYAVVLAVILYTGPPTETSLQESTGRKRYTITIYCAGLNEVPRDAEANYDSGFGSDDIDANSDADGNSGGDSNSDGDYGDNGYTCPDGSVADTAADCCVLTQCNSTTANYCPDDDSYYDFECYTCDGCTACLYPGASCSNITWVAPTKRMAFEELGVPATNSCIVRTTWKRGSLCYLKSNGEGEVKTTIARGTAQTFPLCAPRQGKDMFAIDVSITTKIFVKGTSADYEISGTNLKSSSVLINRVRSNDQVHNKIDDLWYGFVLNTEDDPQGLLGMINFSVAPLFAVIVSASGFSWLGWIGIVSGVSNTISLVYGIALSFLLATALRKFDKPYEGEGGEQNPEEGKKDKNKRKSENKDDKSDSETDKRKSEMKGDDKSDSEKEKRKSEKQDKSDSEKEKRKSERKENETEMKETKKKKSESESESESSSSTE